MTSLRPPSSPSPSPSPVQGANGKNASARASMGPAARPSAGGQGFNLASPRPGGGPPSGRPTSELLGSATFQTPEGESSSRSNKLFYFVFSWVVLERSCPNNLPSLALTWICYCCCYVITAPALSGWLASGHSYHYSIYFCYRCYPHPTLTSLIV
jgi:hypothetical protein